MELRLVVGPDRAHGHHALARAIAHRSSKASPKLPISTLFQPVPTPSTTATVGDPVEGRDLVGQRDRVVLREQRDRGAEHEAVGDCRRSSQEDERVVELLVLVADVAVPVLREREVRVLPDEQRVESGRLREPGDLDGLQRVLGGREQQAELGHGSRLRAQVRDDSDGRKVGACTTSTAQQDAASAAWTAAQKLLGIGRELTVQQELACALRILAHAGWTGEPVGPHHLGEGRHHRHVAQPGGIWVEETQASDIALVSTDAELLDGPWGVSAVVFIHTELHRYAKVIVHGHPYYATLLAASASCG